MTTDFLGVTERGERMATPSNEQGSLLLRRQLMGKCDGMVCLACIS